MKDILSVKNKVIVIVGGAGFLGSQFNKHLASQGAKVVIVDKKVKPPTDVTNPKEVKRAIRDVIKKFGRIDVLIYAAAMDAVPGKPESAQQFTPYDKFPLELWEKELKVNLTGAQIVAQAVVPHMKKKKSGSIIFIASDFALIGPHNDIYGKGKFKDITYITSKAGILGLMRSWAAYLGPYNVRVNALVPGGMFNNQPAEFVKKNSALNMFGRMAQKGEYNGVVQFLSSDASSYMTGSCLVIDGGRTAW